MRLAGPPRHPAPSPQSEPLTFVETAADVTAEKGVYGAGGLPGLAGAAVGTADGGGDLRLEAVSALAPLQGLILRCRGALRAQALRGPEVLGSRAAVTPAGASGDLCRKLHRTFFDTNNAELA